MAASLVGATAAEGQVLRGVVVDQTELPLPGVRIEVIRGGVGVAAVQTQGNGTFELTPIEPDDEIQATLDGFEVARVPASRAQRIVLFLAKATEVTEVRASVLSDTGSAERVAASLRPVEIVRVPTPHPRALETLPRLPAVVRAPDGHLSMDGGPAKEGSLWIDGFDVTDPVSGTSGIDLPVEAIRGVAVIRQPMAVTFSGATAGLASIETAAGPDEFDVGIQSFVPRPRLSEMGFGRIEAFFPRASLGGRRGRVRYFLSEEVSLERVAVPDVTGSDGQPNRGDVRAVTFGRVDIEFSRRHTVTLESIFAPRWRDHVGLSPVRDETAAPSMRTRDVFAGVVSRALVGAQDVLTTRVGLLGHGMVLTPPGEGVARLTPFGWRDNWFSKVDYWAVRQSLAVTWDHAGIQARGQHSLSTGFDVVRRGLRAAIGDNGVRVEDVEGRTARTIEFLAPTRPRIGETSGGVVLRDLWTVNDRLQIDAGARLDWTFRGGRALLSPRLAVRYETGASGRTTLRGGFGRFVGRLPLAGLAFESFPERRDVSFDPATGHETSVSTMRPVLAGLEQPRSRNMFVEVEHRFDSGMQLRVSGRQQLGSSLATVTVQPGGSVARLDSSGRSTYRELQVTARQSWGERSQMSLSYIRADARGEANDFGALYENLDAAILQPGGQANTNDHVPHRLTAWGSVLLPNAFVVSPAIEWHTGYPYSDVDVYRRYSGTPNGARLPPVFSIDLTVFRTFEFFDRHFDLGMQVFDVTGHFNPRDVYPVVGTPGPRFTNSLGRTFMGYMIVNWKSSSERKPANGA